jgi:hypothetical protein
MTVLSPDKSKTQIGHISRPPSKKIYNIPSTVWAGLYGLPWLREIGPSGRKKNKIVELQ